ncbi:Hsp20/alpha crystallin family protein [Pontibacillus yanchengensis]|uniref:Heat-shock protein Hsp20 n=1 Tax=Pontibacillus yanchengensis Y32 TaxID=1385514 RepID=A0A0A2T6Z2_9BACI|nr:Hsp20/alpha crystallin family protein [Pontibacillus yanchengensis]KGP71269.1 heat-shock protein Hsp20 [Pontibacillus yanchengensis Y32]
MDPFQNMQDWRKNLDQFFGNDFWGEFEGILKPQIPQVNVYKSENEILCYVNVPGLDDIDKVDVYVDYTTLELTGVISLQSPHQQLVQEEILQGSFERKIELPYPVRGDKINATYRNGLLIIQLHRLIQQETNKQRIHIRNLEE